MEQFYEDETFTSANPINIGRSIKELRRSKGMTQDDLAEAMHLAKSSISSYENGTRMPSYTVLIMLSGYFGVTTDRLLGKSHIDYIGVAGLTDVQRNAIHTIIDAFVASNSKER